MRSTGPPSLTLRVTMKRKRALGNAYCRASLADASGYDEELRATMILK